MLRRFPAFALALALALALLAATPTAAQEEEDDAPPRLRVRGVVEARFAATGKARSWLDGGTGRARYGGRDTSGDRRGDTSDAGLHLGQLSLVLLGRLSDDLTAHVHLDVDADGIADQHEGRPSLVEGFLEYRRVLSPEVSLRLRGGYTIPPFSLEHPERAWSTRYTITPSAIGSWIGEEVRSAGGEGTVRLALPGRNELDLQAGVFAANDPTGALLAWRGWALHDRQGRLGDEYPLPPHTGVTDPRFFASQQPRTEPFREVDGRPGYHLQARFSHRRRVRLQLGWYDNNGDLDDVKQSRDGDDYAWQTRFLVVGGQLRLGRVTVLGQLMDGRTRMGPALPTRVDAPFRAAFVMGSVKLKKTRLSARYDDFSVDDDDVWRAGKDLNEDQGWATTLALMQDLNRRHRLMAEWLYVDAARPFNATAGAPTKTEQHQFQLAYRLRF